jgi:hypothetical protein
METIQQIRSSLERELADLDRQAESDKSEIRAILDSAQAQGRNNLTQAEDMRAEALMRSAENVAAARRRKADALSRAREVEAEEDEQELRLSVVREAAPRRAKQAYGQAVRIGREERTYSRAADPRGVDFVTDVCRAQVGGDPGAWSRLNRHMDEERVERPYLERAPGDVLTGGMGGLVVPQYLVDMTAVAVAARRPFADACTGHLLPAEGMQMTIPTITTPTSATLQTTQLTTVGAQSLAETDLTLAVKTAAGMQNVSRQSR